MIFFRILEFLRYRWRSKNAHGIHSPFVFDFYNTVLRRSYRRPELEADINKRYLTNTEEIQFKDPKTGKISTTSIQSLAKRTWSGQSFSYFLMKLCEWLRAETFLETGTALGITLSMVSHARGIKHVYSIEGSDELATKAEKLVFKPEEVKLSIIQGEVQTTFEEVLATADPEIVFLDADHRSETIRFYLDLLKKHNGKLKAIIVHDIYWSADMKAAWTEIVGDPDFPLTIDCFHAGIIFPDKDIEKQHFVIKY